MRSRLDSAGPVPAPATVPDPGLPPEPTVPEAPPIIPVCVPFSSTSAPVDGDIGGDPVPLAGDSVARGAGAGSTIVDRSRSWHAVRTIATTAAPRTFALREPVCLFIEISHWALQVLCSKCDAGSSGFVHARKNAGRTMPNVVTLAGPYRLRGSDSDGPGRCERSAVVRISAAPWTGPAGSAERSRASPV
jgi:hypothetical protein